MCTVSYKKKAESTGTETMLYGQNLGVFFCCSVYLNAQFATFIGLCHSLGYKCASDLGV